MGDSPVVHREGAATVLQGGVGGLGGAVGLHHRCGHPGGDGPVRGCGTPGSPGDHNPAPTGECSDSQINARSSGNMN